MRSNASSSEADDIIATLARRAVAAGGRVTIISADKDLMQLVGPGIDMLKPGIQSKPDELIDAIGVLDRPLIVAYLICVVFMFVTLNLAVDILYSLLDPRIRLGGGRG